MKKICTAVFFLMLSLPKILIAQKDSSGIYITPEDFASRKLSYAIDCNTEKHRINSDLIFKGSKIKVKHDGQKYTLDKSKTFGYRSCDQQVYRFVGNLSYQILNPQEPLLLYFYQHLAHAPKFVEQHPPHTSSVSGLGWFKNSPLRTLKPLILITMLFTTQWMYSSRAIKTYLPMMNFTRCTS